MNRLKHLFLFCLSKEELGRDKTTIIGAKTVRYLETGIMITFERVTILKRSKSGKLNTFTSLIKPNS